MQSCRLDIDAIHIIIGKNVKKQRKLKGISQLKLVLNLDYNSVSLISMAEVCANNKNFNIVHLAKITHALGVSIEVFF